MNERTVCIDGPNGKICCVFDEPSDSKEITLIIHGFYSTKNTSSKLIANFFSQKHMNTVRFDLDNCGESELDFATQATVPNYKQQIDTVIDYCHTSGYTTINLLGSSVGGLCAFAAALFRKDIHKLILSSPVVDYKRHMLRRHGDKLQGYLEKGLLPFYRDHETIWYTADMYTTADSSSMFTYANQVRIPVLILQGDADEAIEWELAKEVAPLFPNAQLHVTPNGVHRLSACKDVDKILRFMTTFLQD